MNLKAFHPTISHNVYYVKLSGVSAILQLHQMLTIFDEPAIWLNATKKLRPDRPKFYATSAKKLMPSAPTANKLVQPEKLCLSFYATEALVLKFR